MNFSTVKAILIPEGNVTKITCNGVILWQANALDPELIASLIDFEYTVNDNGTVTLTAWKQTLNGVPSTEMVIPDDSRIIL